MLDVGLKALRGGLASSVVEDEKGGIEMADSSTESMPVLMLTLGKFPLERIGRSRRFFLTFWRNCWSSARSLLISSNRGSFSKFGAFRVGPKGPIDSVSEESESESWRVSSKSGVMLSRVSLST